MDIAPVFRSFISVLPLEALLAIKANLEEQKSEKAVITLAVADIDREIEKRRKNIINSQEV